MKIILREGEEITIKSENGNSSQFRTMICYHNCILTKSEVNDIVKRFFGGERK